MKNCILVLTVLALFVSCKEELVKKPNHLIEKEVMVNIMYDLSLMDAMKYQNPANLQSNNINPTQYIFKKYKIDSLQFAQSNNYYAADYKEYKALFEQLSKRVEKEKAEVDSVIKIEKKKTDLAKKKTDLAKKAKAKKIAKDQVKTDSIPKAKKKS